MYMSYYINTLQKNQCLLLAHIEVWIDIYQPLFSILNIFSVVLYKNYMQVSLKNICLWKVSRTEIREGINTPLITFVGLRLDQKPEKKGWEKYMPPETKQKKHSCWETCHLFFFQIGLWLPKERYAIYIYIYRCWKMIVYLKLLQGNQPIDSNYY